MKNTYLVIEKCNPTFYNLIAPKKPFENSDSNWLDDFNTLYNHNKHNNLIGQTSTETKVARAILEKKPAGTKDWLQINPTLLGGPPSESQTLFNSFPTAMGATIIDPCVRETLKFCKPINFEK